jgi:hypothetical protein
MTLENAKEGDWLAIYGGGRSKEMEQVVRVTNTMVKTDRYTFRRHGWQVTSSTWTRRRAQIATDKERADFLEVEQAKSTTYQVYLLIQKISQANDSIIHNLGFKQATGYVPILNTAIAQLEAALATLQAPPTSTPAPNHDV